MAVAYSDLGAMLWVIDPVISENTYQYLVPVRSIPATGADPAQIEVTELDSSYKQNILDRQETPMFGFMYNYTVENFKRVQSFLDGSTSHKFLITYQDKSGFTFEAAGQTWTNELTAGTAIEAQMGLAVSKKAWVENASSVVNSNSVPIGKKNPFASGNNIVLSPIADRSIAEGITSIITANTDPDDVTITAVSSDITIATVTVTSKEISIVGVLAGDAIITVTASKAGMNSATDKFIVVVTS